MRTGKQFRVMVLLALGYAIEHTQDEFEKTIFKDMKRTISNSSKTVMCDITFVRQALKYGYIFTTRITIYEEFVSIIQMLESEKETLIHV